MREYGSGKYIYISRIQEDMATEFENILSQRSKKLAVKVQEFAAIKTLVDLLLDINIEIKNFENFFASFTIEQIGKEFDLIKPDKDNFVLNIELKSENVGVMYVKIFIVAKGISSRYGCNSGRKGEWLIS